MIKPIGDYVLVEVEKQEEQTAGGIILPEMKKDRPQTGIVVDLPRRMITVEAFSGKQISEINIDLNIGTKVWFKMWSGEPVKYEGKEYLLIHKKDIIAYEGGEK